MAPLSLGSSLTKASSVLLLFPDYNTGAGVAIDTISTTTEADNLTGTLKQNFPRAFGLDS